VGSIKFITEVLYG